MSYFTSAPTFGTLEVLPSAKLNLLADGIQTWETYTPTWSAATTAPVLGNGTIAGRFNRIGKTVHFSIKIAAGSTTTYGAGIYKLTLPVPPATTHPCHFLLYMFDSSAGAHFSGMTIQVSGSTVDLVCDAGGAGGNLVAVGATAPFTFAAGDLIEVSGIYEAA